MAERPIEDYGKISIDVTAYMSQLQPIFNMLNPIPGPDEVVISSGAVIKGYVMFIGAGVNPAINVGDTIAFRATNYDLYTLQKNSWISIDHTRYVATLPPPEILD